MPSILAWISPQKRQDDELRRRRISDPKKWDSRVMEDLTVKSFNDEQTLYRLSVDAACVDDSIPVFYSFFHSCYNRLCELPSREFVYPSTCISNWDVGAIERENRDLINDLGTGRGVVYVIYSCAGDGSDLGAKYVGSSKKLRQRLREHLISKSEGTASCLNLVKSAVCRDGEKIYIAWITISPVHLYYCVEQAIIAIEKTVNHRALPWNGEPGTRSGRSQNSANS